MRNLSRVIVVLFFLLFVFSVQAGNSPLLIVEVQIAGENPSDDYIKIYNLTDSDIYLGNYQGSYLRLVKRTKTSAKDILIKSWSREPEAKIPARGYYLWASSKDENYPSLVKANAFTKKVLAEDNGVALRLDSLDTGEIIDAVGWGDFNNVLFEGTPFSKNPAANQQLKRKLINGIYQDTNNNNQDFYLSETISKEETQPEPQLEEQKSITYPSGVVINEILPDPEGIADADGEYIEIFNKNNFKVDLSGWKIEDTIGSSTIYIFPEGKTLNPESFLVLFRSETKIILNNEGDNIKLIQPEGTIIDEVKYEKAIKGQSYNRTSAGWLWSATLTPGLANIVSAQEAEKTEKDTKEKFTPKIEKEVEPTKMGLAEVAEPFKQEYLAKQFPESLSLFLIAFTLAIFSGITILILKKKLKTSYIKNI